MLMHKGGRGWCKRTYSYEDRVGEVVVEHRDLEQLRALLRHLPSHPHAAPQAHFTRSTAWGYARVQHEGLAHLRYGGKRHVATVGVDLQKVEEVCTGGACFDVRQLGVEVLQARAQEGGTKRAYREQWHTHRSTDIA